MTHTMYRDEWRTGMICDPAELPVRAHIGSGPGSVPLCGATWHFVNQHVPLTEARRLRAHMELGKTVTCVACCQALRALDGDV